jgi:hypothetical protein
MRKAAWVLLCAAVALPLFAEERAAGGATALPLKKVSLFSSGVGYFEHSGVVSGNETVRLTFGRAALNDALKSLVINDREGGAPQINYLSETTLTRTLQSLKIDLSGEPDLPGILRSLQGAEIALRAGRAGGACEEIRGRIVTVDARDEPLSRGGPSYQLSLSTEQGLRTVSIADISSFSFTDAAIQKDLGRALDLISASRAERTRDVSIELSGKRRREVIISYVIPTPVWKISYRLDLNAASPALQSWAIVDNDGDIDWNGVEVSLVSGKPVSFVQALYPPYYTARPALPLAGVGIAEARVYDSGWADGDAHELRMAKEAPAPAVADYAYGAVAEASGAAASEAASSNRALGLARRGSGVAGGASIAAAGAKPAGEQFEFTLKKPVRLERQQSAMLPLFDGHIKAKKTLIFSGQNALRGGAIHPSIGAELVNSTGIKLPAGSMTVFDGGTYAGDALLDFFDENETRIISYGEDLSVSGSLQNETRQTIETVKINKGFITFGRKQLFSRIYTIRNSSADVKRLFIEHPITRGAHLITPERFSEQTAALYRFETELRAHQILAFTVVEERPLSERLALAPLPRLTLLSYSENTEIPEPIRAAFQEALRFKSAADEALEAAGELEKQRVFLLSEQERARANLSAAGNKTAAGKGYLARLTALDKEIAAVTANIESGRRKAAAAQSEYETFIASLDL